MSSLLAWLSDVLIGPRCQHPGCSYWARGPRSLDAHRHLEHAGDGT